VTTDPWPPALELPRARPMNSADRAGVTALLTASFQGSSEASLTEQLWSEGDVVLGVVAATPTRIVGLSLLSRLDAPLPAVALAPVAVLPEWQGRGVGSHLVRSSLAGAGGGGWLIAFVLGDPDWYGRLGFERHLAAGFTTPFDGPYLQARALTPAGLANPTGRIAYPAAFNPFP